MTLGIVAAGYGRLRVEGLPQGSAEVMFLMNTQGMRSPWKLSAMLQPNACEP